VNRILIAALVVLQLAACSSGSDIKYLDSQTAANLAIPPDLTSVDLNEKFKIPANISSSIGETVNKVPVLAQVEGVRLVGSEDFYWLEIDGKADNLYQTIKNFWASEGFALDIDEPVIGIMQTDWIYKEEGAVDKDQNFFEALFSSKNFSATQDQFRTRIANESNAGVTRVYISHRGTRYEHRLQTKQTENETPEKWRFRDPEPELEIEMLSRLMVYLGLQQAEVDEQVEGVKLFASRATIHTDNKENETYILVNSVKQRTWNRLLHELDRLDFEVVTANESMGFSGDGVISVKTQYEIEKKSGGFLSFFSGSETQMVKKQVIQLKRSSFLSSFIINLDERQCSWRRSVVVVREMQL
jgi:outer membrane protein assembly factor BamC